MKAWIGPCSLSNSGLWSSISCIAAAISRPVARAGATVLRGLSIVPFS
jgi:hypothetical protein